MAAVGRSILKYILLGMLVCLTPTARAQDQEAGILRRAVQCLFDKGFLTGTRVGTRTFGYLLDENSYPGEKMLYVVYYPQPSRTNAVVFTVFFSEQGGHWDLDIQNNAGFILSKDGDEGVSFVTPPLGGTWTQEHLLSAIKQIEKQPKSTISTSGMLKVDSSVSCEAYTDPQPIPSPK